MSKEIICSSYIILESIVNVQLGRVIGENETKSSLSLLTGNNFSYTEEKF